MCCQVCHSRPQHFDGTRTHPYCSKTCARKMKTNGPKQNAIPIVASGEIIATLNSSPLIQSHALGICHVPGCNKPVHQSNNVSAKYCSQSHKRCAFSDVFEKMLTTREVSQKALVYGAVKLRNRETAISVVAHVRMRPRRRLSCCWKCPMIMLHPSAVCGLLSSACSVIECVLPSC